MTIRRTFLLLLAPLFLLLAGVNGALLFVWEQAEARRGLENQAIAAAVTTAAFVAGGHDLAQALADPQRAAAIRTAASKVTGLRGLYLLDADGRAVRLAGAGGDPGRFAAPRAPVALPIADDASGCWSRRWKRTWPAAWRGVAEPAREAFRRTPLDRPVGALMFGP